MTSVTDLLEGLSDDAGFKVPVRVGTTAALSALEGLLTIDGVTLVAGDRVLVKNQSDTTENGIYVADTSEWERAKDFDGASEVVNGTLVRINSGTVNQRALYAVSGTDPIVPGTTAITFVTAGVGSASDIAFAPTGTVAATTVQSAIAEVASEATAAIAAIDAGISAYSDTILSQTTATLWRAAAGVPAILGVNFAVYTANDSFAKATLPAHVTHIHVGLWAPGGGGGGADADGTFRAVAGSGGEFGYACIAVASLGTTETITLPSGGAGGTSANSPTAGTNGSTASFGSHLTCIGGVGGTAGISGVQAGVAGGTGGTGGSFHVAGGDSSIKENDSNGISLGGDGGFAAGTGARTNISTAGRRPGGGGTGGNPTGPVNGAAGGGSMCIVWWH